MSKKTFRRASIFIFSLMAVSAALMSFSHSEKLSSEQWNGGNESYTNSDISLKEEFNTKQISAEVVEKVVPALPIVKSAQAEGQFSKPRNIIIPSIGVNSNVVPVGVTKANNLDVPPNLVETGWYKYGTIPGNIGTAVLDGHVDNGGNVPGVYKNLKDLRVGESIYIENENGERLHFKVVKSDIYQTSSFPSEKVFKDEGLPLIRIITCHGRYNAYNEGEKTYDQRLVVTAQLE